MLEMDLKYGIYLAISVISLAICMRALYILRDKDYSFGMIFLRAKKVTNIYTVLYFGVATPLAMALAMQLVLQFYPSAMLNAIAIICFIASFIMINVVLVSGARFVGGA